ncbi:hypothetical protein Sme01_04200 [Sphaerisporangium melleum]|uniref:Uncharacterized protein n=1 Tax=Sphaerisporangium melleum TaxID=321316 RepID=A0A917QPR7_9ACTN|nr:hypothetical protein [Sphaerisporangium melleum]GGK62259.1 hypothetical protein GCM10007964_01750 [Sphaerisporangium melleum]GII67944.1 hypothetical protein Sme01_04200 [Sphaerisporangium melleum]
MSAVLEQNRIVAVMVERARTWDTGRLEAERQEGLRLAAEGGLTALWEETLQALDVVLFERADAKAVPSEATA